MSVSVFVMSHMLKTIIVFILVVVFCSGTTVCKPRDGLKLRQCRRLISRSCQGLMRWTGKGCSGPNHSKLRDGGCQCAGYCGFHCKSACESVLNRPFCKWKNKQCISKKTGQATGPIAQCEPTSSPSMNPSMSPSMSPSMLLSSTKSIDVLGCFNLGSMTMESRYDRNGVQNSSCSPLYSTVQYDLNVFSSTDSLVSVNWTNGNCGKSSTYFAISENFDPTDLCGDTGFFYQPGSSVTNSGSFVFSIPTNTSLYLVLTTVASATLDCCMSFEMIGI